MTMLRAATILLILAGVILAQRGGRGGGGGGGGRGGRGGRGGGGGRVYIKIDNERH